MATNFSKKEFGPRIDHTTYIFLVDPEGKTRGYYHHALAPEKMAEFIRQHI
jgi:cytochrome oxidase Cu insertion factor (SCO1/SenC/PrrC family)